MIFESVVFGVLAAAGWGIADFVAAVVSKRLGLLRTIVGVHIVSIAVTTAYVVVAWNLSVLSINHWLVMLGISGLGFITYISFYRALQIGPVAVISPVVSTYAVVVILLAMVFAGERLSLGQGIGTSACILGVVLASTNFGGNVNGGRLISTGVLLALVATVAIGIWQFGVGIISREIGWFLPIYISRLLTLGLIAPLAIVRREWPWQRLTVLLAFGVVTIGVVETGGLLAFARGAEIGVISIVAAASITYPLIPIVGGLVIFRERLGITQVSGLGIALSGLLLLTLSS